MKWTIGTTTLCTVSLEVEAETEHDALRVALGTPRRLWVIGELYGDVDLEEGTYEVMPVEEDPR